MVKVAVSITPTLRLVRIEADKRVYSAVTRNATLCLHFRHTDLYAVNEMPAILWRERSVWQSVTSKLGFPRPNFRFNKQDENKHAL
jgi:hypothetical protein